LRVSRPYIFIRNNEHRRIKNPQSTRRIPLVAEPCRLGFLRYRSAIKALGYKLLFPDLRANSDRTALGDVFYDGFVGHWELAIPDYREQKKVFHSIRKTGGDNLKDAGVTSEIRADILGMAEEIRRKKDMQTRQNLSRCSRLSIDFRLTHLT
jgi:hypothetical protein